MTLVRSPPVPHHDADPAAPDVVWTIVVGGGSGARFGSLKQFERLAGRSVLDWSCATAEQVSDGVFVTGDARRGQSLVVWAIAEGRTTARQVCEWLDARSADTSVSIAADTPAEYTPAR